MSIPQITWGHIERYCDRRPAYSITSSGGDKIIKGPAVAGTPTGRNVVRIGHTSSKSKKTPVLHCYVQALRRAFGITREDLLLG